MTKASHGHGRPSAGDHWSTSTAARAPRTDRGSATWATTLALALWVLLLSAFGVVGIVALVLLEGVPRSGAEAMVDDALDDPLWLLLTWTAIIGSLVPSVALGLRAEQLHGRRSAVLVTLGTIIGYVVLVLAGLMIASIPLALGALVTWFLRRRGREPT